MSIAVSPLQPHLENASPSPPNGLQTSVAQRRRLAKWIESQRARVLASWAATQFDESRINRFAINGVNELSSTDLQRLFVRPLFDLLVAFASTGERRYGDMYQDERLRYAPHQADPTVRADFFREVLPRDEDVLLAPIAHDIPLSIALRELLNELHSPLLEIPSERPVRVLALGDCLMNELRVFLTSRCRRAGVPLDFRALYFSAAMGKRVSAEQVLRFLGKNPVDVIAMSFLSYEGIPPYGAFLRDVDTMDAAAVEKHVDSLVGIMREFMRELRESTDATFLVHNAGGLPLTRARRTVKLFPAVSTRRKRALARLNSAIAELSENTENTILIDEETLTRERGHRASSASVVPHRKFRNALFHASRFGEYLASPYSDVISSYHELHKAKVLLVDFDNTLWKGVMADGPVEQHRDRQLLLRRVKDAGILLVALSKNDPVNVRWSEMVLQPSDFVLQKVSWDLKVQSIQQAASELDLGLDSFVLVDDNPVERELVRTQLPTVRVLDAENEFTWRSIERMLQFPNTKQTEEAQARTEMYRQAAQRREAVSGRFDYAVMMASLELEIQFGRASARDVGRIVELVQRTNQFNTTSIRYSRQSIEGFLRSDGHAVYVGSLSDKFGSLGLVAVAIVEDKGEERIVDTFVMSCRAMGFEMERAMLRGVLDAQQGATRFIGRFILTDRNTPAANFFSSNGFVQRSETDWILNATQPLPEMPAWFKVRSR
jgi:FkbH-like protein